MEVVARRGGANRMGGSSGGSVDDNPFAALCNSSVLDGYMSTMDSAMAVSLDTNDYLHHDIDSLWEAMLLSTRGDLRWAVLWGEFFSYIVPHPIPLSLVLESPVS